MWVSYLGVSLSLIAVIISLFTYLFNKKWVIKDKFENFTLEVYSAFDDFMNLSNVNQHNSFELEFTTVCDALKHEKSFDVKNNDRYNAFMLKYFGKKDLLFKKFQRLHTLLTVMQNKKTSKKIQSLIELISILFKRMDLYYNYIIYGIFKNLIDYITKRIAKENFEQTIHQFYENIFIIRSFNKILSNYRKDMEVSTRIQVLNSCMFSNIHINDYDVMFSDANKKLELLGIDKFLSTNNENYIVDNNFKKNIVDLHQTIKYECSQFIQNIFNIVG